MAGCNYNGTSYSEGALICANGRELRCSGRQWQETGYDCAASNETGSEYARIATGGQALHPGIAAATTTQAGCISFIRGAKSGIRLFNNCDHCAIAMISWSDGGFTEHRVAAYSYLDIPMRASGAQIAGSRPC